MRRGFAVATAALLLATVAVVYVGHSAAETRELLGKGDEWIAKEDGMALDVADELAKRCVCVCALTSVCACVTGTLPLPACGACCWRCAACCGFGACVLCVFMSCCGSWVVDAHPD
jgi:hypothetical protein